MKIRRRLNNWLGGRENLGYMFYLSALISVIALEPYRWAHHWFAYVVTLFLWMLFYTLGDKCFRQPQQFFVRHKKLEE